MKYVATVDGKNLTISVDKAKDLLLFEVNGRKHSLDFKYTEGSSLHSMIVGGRQYEVVVERADGGFVVYMKGEVHKVRISEQLLAAPRMEKKTRMEVRAAMPGLVVALKIAPGARVDRGDGLLVLEAMKMQNEVRAPERGIATEIHVKEGSAVEKGEKLVTIQT